MIDLINRSPEQAARITQQELGDLARVSKPVVISCFRRLGFESFRDFQASFEQFFATQIDSLSASRAVSGRVHSLGELIEEAAAVDTRAINRLRDSLDAGLLETLVRKLHAARTVYVFGESTGSYAAHYLAHRLPRYRVPTVLVPHDVRHQPDVLHALGEDDVFLLFHYSDDDRWISRLSPRRSGRAGWTALLSATIHPDYVDAADLFIHVPRGEIGFKNSMAVPLHFANLVLLSYELVFRDEVETYLTELESIRSVLQDAPGKKQSGKE